MGLSFIDFQPKKAFNHEVFGKRFDRFLGGKRPEDVSGRVLFGRLNRKWQANLAQRESEETARRLEGENRRQAEVKEQAVTRQRQQQARERSIVQGLEEIRSGLTNFFPTVVGQLEESANGDIQPEAVYTFPFSGSYERTWKMMYQNSGLSAFPRGKREIGMKETTEFPVERVVQTLNTFKDYKDFLAFCKSQGYRVTREKIYSKVREGREEGSVRRDSFLIKKESGKLIYVLRIRFFPDKTSKYFRESRPW